MPPDRPDRPKQHRSAISIDLKKQICEWSQNNKNKTHSEIADYFNKKDSTLNIERSTVSKILKKSEKWISVTEEGSKEIFRYKGVKFSELDHAMNLWIENVMANGNILTDLLIKEKARFFANALNIQENECMFSNGWLYKFKKRNNVRKYHMHGESGSAPLASLPEERARLQLILGQYTLDRIYNIDET